MGIVRRLEQNLAFKELLVWGWNDKRRNNGSKIRINPIIKAQIGILTQRSTKINSAKVKRRCG